MSDEQKKPQAGEWWSDSGEIVFIIGRNSAGNITYERDGLIEEMADESDLITWHHEPRCTSFGWIEPAAEVWPKWYILDETQGTCERPWAIERTSEDEAVRHGYDEHWNKTAESCAWHSKAVMWLEVTESEALARLQPPVQTCPDCNQPLTPGHADVCPEAWVVQDRVPVRHESTIDECRWSSWPNENDWISNNPYTEGWMHGRIQERDNKIIAPAVLSVRTRRKNLPPLPAESRPDEVPATPDPGEWWRLIDKAVDVPQEGDQVNCCIDIEHPCWVNRAQTGSFDMSPVLHYRRRITPVHPLGPESSEPDTVPIQFMVPRRILDGEDWPVRAVLAGGQVEDTATWLPVTIDRLGNASVRRSAIE